MCLSSRWRYQLQHSLMNKHGSIKQHTRQTAMKTKGNTRPVSLATRIQHSLTVSKACGEGEEHACPPCNRLIPRLPGCCWRFPAIKARPGISVPSLRVATDSLLLPSISGPLPPRNDERQGMISCATAAAQKIHGLVRLVTMRPAVVGYLLSPISFAGHQSPRLAPPLLPHRYTEKGFTYSLFTV